jgi:hypothetical protein
MQKASLTPPSLSIIGMKAQHSFSPHLSSLICSHAHLNTRPECGFSLQKRPDRPIPRDRKIVRESIVWVLIWNKNNLL